MKAWTRPRQQQMLERDKDEKGLVLYLGPPTMKALDRIRRSQRRRPAVFRRKKAMTTAAMLERDKDEKGLFRLKAAAISERIAAAALAAGLKAKMSGAASASSSATWGKGSRSCSTTRSSWPGQRPVAGRWCAPWWPHQVPRARLGLG